jgi:hypothetical protein
MKVGIILTAVLLASAADPSTPPRLPEGVTCEFVRAKVAEHGKVIAYAWARLNGFSKREIAEAKRCLK